jgi:hypothetical protein
MRYHDATVTHTTTQPDPEPDQCLLPPRAQGTEVAMVQALPVDSIDEFESLPRLFFFGLQHVLVMYAGTVAVPLILGAALRLSPARVIALSARTSSPPAWLPCSKPSAGGSSARASR